MTEAESQPLDTTLRRRVDEQLRRQIEDLEKRNRNLEQFAYVAAHDLSEPLRAMSSFARLLRDSSAGLSAEAGSCVELIVDGAARMRRLIDDLLAYARVESFDDRFTQVDCNQVVEGVIGDLAPSIEATGTRITVEPLPSIKGSEGLLAQLFQSILSNAIKFAQTGVPARVRIRAQSHSGLWHFTVEDNGIGIDPSHRERVFHMFHRLHQREEYEGSGMGLAISLSVVTHHGGRAWIEGRPGGGSVFHFTIPEA